MTDGPVVVNPNLDGFLIVCILISLGGAYTFGDPSLLGLSLLLYFFLPYVRDIRLRFESEEDMEESMKCFS